MTPVRATRTVEPSPVRGRSRIGALFDRVRKAVAPDYQLERELAGGGMGVVFVAWEPALARRVALKVLRPELATAVATERFRREATTLAGAKHPNVVTIHRVGERDGLHFLVMDLFGESLAHRLRGGALPETTALRIGASLLAGLGHVHRLGIIHRDVKPANIFLRDDDPVLGDFGIAKREPDGEAITRTGESPGTRAYMAPEQLAAGTVTPATDQYAAGMVIYEMLTGRRWERTGDGDAAEWRAVRRPLARALRRALAPAPIDRWPDTTSFARALRSASRPHGAWLPAATLVVATAAVAGIATRGCPPAPPPASAVADVAILPFQAAPADSALAVTVAHATSEHLENAFRDHNLLVTPMPLVVQWWSRWPAADSLPPTVFRDLHTARVAWGRLERVGGAYRVRVTLRDSTGVDRPITSYTLQPGFETDAGFSLAQAIAADLAPRRAREFVGSPLRGRNSMAVDSLMAGDRAFWQENWSAAERLYRAAIAIDSTLGRAWWGLYNVERWRRSGFDVDLARVYQRYPADFRALDLLLIEADLATGRERLRGYEAARAAFPHHAYPWLLLGNELFHRGPLLGTGLDSTGVVLRAAGALDPYLAPSFSTLAWALIRRGDAAGARDALDHYATLARPFPESEFCFQCLLTLAYVARFDPRELGSELATLLDTPGGSGSLGRGLRWAMSFGVPDGQAEVAALLTARAPNAAARVEGLLAEGLALVALGRVAEALARFDASAALSGDPELAFQSAEWRVLLPALGVPGVEPDARAAARDALGRYTGSGDSLSRRARWALAVAAFAGADIAEGQRHSAALEADSAAARWSSFTAPFEAAARGHTSRAAAMVPASGMLAADGPGDPFVRAALYLAIGTWYAPGDPAAADRALLWYENADLVQWPLGAPQAAEIDWALETFARYRRATLARSTGNRDRACALLPDVVHRWRHADPAYADLVREAARLLADCAS